MDVPRHVASKIEPSLEATLQSAGSQDVVRIVARLASPARSASEMPRPDAFRSREEWRKELISRKRTAVQQAAGPLLDRLKDLGVEVLAGGDLSETLVLQGRPTAIVQALELDGLAHADVDRAFSIPLHK